MTVDSIFELSKKLIDVLICWMVFYFILKSLRKNVKMVLLFKGVFIVIVLKILSDLLNLVTINFIMDYIIEWGPIAIIIVFQPEIRNVLEQLGRSQLLGRHKVLTVDEREKLVYEIAGAVDYLKKNRIGALIVLERDNSLVDYISKSKKLYADISTDLLITIFWPNNPLHDGGVIIQGDRITCAGAVFKTSMNPNVSKKLGTRHRAALGVAEETDAIALIVSEETGAISIAVDGNINYNLTLEEFKIMLLEELKPKMEVFYDADVNEEGEEDE